LEQPIAAAKEQHANHPRPDPRAVKRINDKSREEMRRAVEHHETEGIVESSATFPMQQHSHLM
jgi:hypothetical protein